LKEPLFWPQNGVIMPKYTLRLFDTLLRKEDPILPSDGKAIRFYTCGPTIYDVAHIGNFRTFLFEDLLRRTLKLFGFSIVQVMNLTDVDDKTIRGAMQKGISLKEYTEPYAQAFFQDLKSLRIEPAEHYPKATDYIPEMIKMVQDLEAKGAAYRHSDNSLYFSLEKAIGYGKLSHLDLDSLMHGASGRIIGDDYGSERIADFVLWKAYDPKRDGTVYWESPLGKGRPGWHLECSVMARKLLGDTIDLHAGGVDLIFPHHENEIAQSETCTGKPFSLHWAHAEHLLVDHKKMSKSLGNFYTLRDLLAQGYSPVAIRFFLQSNHYRTQLNFTTQALDAASTSIKRIRDFAERLEGNKTNEPPQKEFQSVVDQAEDDFCMALSQDLNINEALAALFEFIRHGNHLLDSSAMTDADRAYAQSFLQKADTILAVIEPEKDVVPDTVQDLINQREQARKNKEWARSDALRAQIKELGYLLEDLPEGQRVTRGTPCQPKKN
jgi:cysteinyl-tRNA synthetase